MSSIELADRMLCSVAEVNGSRLRNGTISKDDRKPRDFITGFLTTRNGKPTVYGRPCAILRLAPDTFLLSDDYLGLIYYIHPLKD